MQNSPNILNLGNHFFRSYFHGQCSVEHVLGNADLGSKGWWGKEDYATSDMSCHSVLLASLVYHSCLLSLDNHVE